MPNQEKIYQKKRIAVVADLYPRYEGDVRGIFVVDYMLALEGFCTFVVINPDIRCNANGVFDWLGYKVYRFGAKGKLRVKLYSYLKLAISIATLSKSLQPVDIIHSHGSVLSGMVAKYLAWSLKKKLVVTEHTGPFTSITERPFIKFIARFVIQGADHTTVVSNCLAEEISAAGIVPKEITVIGNPVDTHVFRFLEEKRKKRIIFVGRLSVEKNPLQLVQAFFRLRLEREGWVLMLIGDGDQREKIQDFIAQKNEFSAFVDLRGWMKKDAIADILNKSSFLVLPSRHESFGLVIAESLCTGTPVVCPNVSAMKELVREEDGILYNPMEESALYSAILKMIDSLTTFDNKEIAVAAHGRFSYEVFRAKMSEIYEI